MMILPYDVKGTGEPELADQLLDIQASGHDGRLANIRFLNLMCQIRIDNGQYEYGRPVPSGLLNGFIMDPKGLMRVYKANGFGLYLTRVHRNNSRHGVEELRLVHAVERRGDEQPRIDKTVTRHNQM